MLSKFGHVVKYESDKLVTDFSCFISGSFPPQSQISPSHSHTGYPPATQPGYYPPPPGAYGAPPPSKNSSCYIAVIYTAACNIHVCELWICHSNPEKGISEYA